MFKTLKEKLSSWFKKPEKAEEEPEKPIEKKQGKSAKKPRKEKPKKELAKKQEPSPKQPIIKESSTVEEEQKRGFFKRIFSRKKVHEEDSPETVTPEVAEVKPKEEPLPVQETPLIETPPVTKEEEPIEEKAGFFTKLARKLSISTLTQEQFDELFPELEFTLLENNVALEVIDKIHDELSKDLVGIEVKKSQVKETIVNSLKETINSLLIEPPDLIEQIKKKEGIFTIIFVGINGSGKTTTVARIAHLLKENNISCVLAAADTFRAASIEQLKTHANNLNVPIISSEYGADPSSVAFDAKKYAEAHHIKTVLIDTAGRMYTKTNLIKEMEKIVRVSKPDLKLFVGESLTGNDATSQCRTFNEAINIDGIILTKADVDEKAGTVLSVSQVTGKPIYFLGVGQSYPDLIPFSKKDILKNLGLE